MSVTDSTSTSDHQYIVESTYTALSTSICISLNNAQLEGWSIVNKTRNGTEQSWNIPFRSVPLLNHGTFSIISSLRRSTCIHMYYIVRSTGTTCQKC